MLSEPTEIEEHNLQNGLPRYDPKMKMSKVKELSKQVKKRLH